MTTPSNSAINVQPSVTPALGATSIQVPTTTGNSQQPNETINSAPVTSAAHTTPIAGASNPTTPIPGAPLVVNGLDVSNSIPIPNYKLNERLISLEKANKEALSQNQVLALKNDNLKTQVLSLQGDRGTQMFIYGALVMLLGIVIGYLAGRVMGAKQRSFWR